jgi:hypothetical protein
VPPHNSIEPFAATASGLEPDFVAMRLAPDADRISHLSLIDTDGGEIPNSRREIRPVRTAVAPLVYVPAIIPLLLLVVLRLRRVRPSMHAAA